MDIDGARPARWSLRLPGVPCRAGCVRHVRPPSERSWALLARAPGALKGVATPLGAPILLPAPELKFKSSARSRTSAIERVREQQKQLNRPHSQLACWIYLVDSVKPLETANTCS